MKHIFGGVAALAFAFGCAPADDGVPANGSEDAEAMMDAADSGLPDPLVERADYSNDNLWLCKPGPHADACDVSLDATVINADGSTSVEPFEAAAEPAVDCFFVYPTVSLDPGYLSDWEPDAMELDDIKLQFARFGEVCRTYAPLYRQFTLTALRAAATGVAPEGERPPAGIGGLQDVSDAFNWYLENENDGRPFVLVGHSQGAGVLRGLIQNEIDGKPLQEQMLSAMLLGTAVMVPPGKVVGGNFQSVPVCEAEDQTGCVITYATFREGSPPPEESRFGRASEGMVAACTNPADLAGNSLAESDAYFLTEGFLNGSGGADQPAWLEPAPEISTPFVRTPGLISTQCAANETFSYLEMHVNADPSDPRTDEVGGEVIRATGPDPSWGLHLIDMDIAMGDFLRIVERQTAAYCATASCGQSAE